jgi:Lar family restriction alleviation protein
MTNYDLKPCPFCGGEGRINPHGAQKSEKTYAVGCTRCRATINDYFEVDEAVAMWNRWANPLQKWEPGSKPPNGWYFFITKSGERIVYSIYSGMAIMPERNLSRSWEWWSEIGYQIYGPIPEPEVEA